MAIKTNKLTKIVNDLSEIEKGLVENSNALMQIDDAIEKSKNDKPTTNATKAESKGKVAEMFLSLMKIDSELEKLQTDLGNINGNNALAALSVLKHKLQSLGLTIRLGSDPDKPNRYVFDFGKSYTIIVDVLHTQLSLVQISPPHNNFENIKKHFDESQDLVGLFIFFASMRSKANE